MRKVILSVLLAGGAAMAVDEPLEVRVDAGKVVAKCQRGNLMGINIAAYNSEQAFRKAMTGVLAKLDVGLIRMPGGSLSDKCYWNGNGVVVNGKIDQSKYKDHYWQVDYSGYTPGFTVDNSDWSKAAPMAGLDVLKMHEITRLHPVARNLVTVNAGSGRAEMAAQWVRWANKKHHFGVKYWEVGNELNGSWEAGHIRPDGSSMTAEKYAAIFTEYAKAMKAEDSSIMVGGPSCDIGHHDDYFEPLFRLAGKYIDFVTLHFYSLRSSLAPERELFDGLDTLAPITKRIFELSAKYQPERIGRIGVSITEWNSKLPKDRDAYRLFNGLWFSAWVGEMMKAGITSATVWDMFSNPAENAHGLLVKRGEDYVPTGRYWAFYLWTHFMGDTLVETAVPDNPDLHIYATRDGGRLCVMMMNESRATAHRAKLDIKGMPVGQVGRLVTLSSREYFWNKYKREADWNFGPKVESIVVSDEMSVVVPPYSVRIVCVGDSIAGWPAAQQDRAPGAPELRLLLPEKEFGDLETEGWVRAFTQGKATPYSEGLGTVQLSVKGNAEIEPAEVRLDCAAARFVLHPKGPGKVTVTASCGGLTASRVVNFSPVELTEQKVWGFDDGAMPPNSTVNYPTEIVDSAGHGKVLQIHFDGGKIEGQKNHIYAVNRIPRGVAKERIGGVCFDVLLPEDLECSDDNATLQAVMQSTGAYWIPCGSIKLSEKLGKWQHVVLEVPDKKFLQVMDRAFSVRFVVSAGITLRGNILIDNVGFLMRPE